MSLGRCQLAILAVLATAVAADPGFEMGLGRRQAPPAPDNVVYVTDANTFWCEAPLTIPLSVRSADHRSCPAR